MESSMFDLMQGAIIQNFQLYLTGTPMIIATYLSWYKLETQLRCT